MKFHLVQIIYHDLARLKFAKDHLHNREDDLENVMRSDETKMDLFGLDTTSCVWREHYTYCVAWGSKLLLWGCGSPYLGQIIYKNETWLGLPE